MKRFFTLCIVSISFLGINANASSSTYGINPFKTILNGLSNRAKDLFDHATRDGLILETNGAEQVLNIIANAQLAYEKQLSATSHTITAQEQKILSGIAGLLDQVQNHTIESISAQITQIALLIPTVGNRPQIRTWSGNTVFSSQSTVTIRLKGVFKFASNLKYQPTMNVAGTSYQASEKTETLLSFDIPLNQLEFSQDKVNYQTATFKIPYKTGLWSSKKVAEYKLKIILLPINPGKFEFFVSTTIPQLERKSKVCNLSWAGHEDMSKFCYPDPGYTIEISTIHKELSEEHGGGFGHDHWDLGSDYNSPSVGISFRVKSDSDESYVGYKITYSMTREVPVPIDIKLKSDDSKWGNSQTFTITDIKSTWKAIYTQFDNRKAAFATSSESNPYVRIKQIADQVIVSFAPFDL